MEDVVTQNGSVPEASANKAGAESAAESAAKSEAVKTEMTGETAKAAPEDNKEEKADNKAAATPEAKIAELEVKLAESHDQFLRKAAEFENFRKRMNQEKTSAIEFANQSLLLDLIPIIDDFERAIDAGETLTTGNANSQAGSSKSDSFDAVSFLEGFKMIEKRLTSQLETKWGLKRFNSAGEPFDPNLHEALYMEKSPDVKEAVVQEDLFKGYYLKDRVIRAAKVKVLMPEDRE